MIRSGELLLLILVLGVVVRTVRQAYHIRVLFDVSSSQNFRMVVVFVWGCVRHGLADRGICRPAF